MTGDAFYFIDDTSTRRGPIPLSQAREQPLRPETMVWTDDVKDWHPAREMARVWAAFCGAPLPPADAAASASLASTLSSAPSPLTPRSMPPPLRPPVSPRQRRGGMGAAMWALILSIAGIAWWVLPGWVFIAGPISAVAVVVAIVALAKSKREGGKGFAVAGLILGLVNLLLAGVMLFVIGLFVTADARREASRPRVVPPPAVPATIPTMPRFDIKQPTFRTSYPTSVPTTAPSR